MQWERWTGWKRGDPRWRAHVIDTTDLTIEQVVLRRTCTRNWRVLSHAQVDRCTRIRIAALRKLKGEDE
jgi:hypothetical protein